MAGILILSAVLALGGVVVWIALLLWAGPGGRARSGAP